MNQRDHPERHPWKRRCAWTSRHSEGPPGIGCINGLKNHRTALPSTRTVSCYLVPIGAHRTADRFSAWKAHPVISSDRSQSSKSRAELGLRVKRLHQTRNGTVSVSVVSRPVRTIGSPGVSILSDRLDCGSESKSRIRSESDLEATGHLSAITAEMRCDTVRTDHPRHLESPLGRNSSHSWCAATQDHTASGHLRHRAAAAG